MVNKMVVKGNIYCAGVYGMRIKDSDKYLYLGSGLEINDALSRHLHFLKRGLYADTNKEILQKYYDLGELVFEVVKESCHDNISEMSIKEKEDLNEALSVLEKMYIDLYKDSICNSQMSVKRHSSNKNSITTFKRRKANLGNNNPNRKYDEKIIAEILYLKMNGYKPKEIEKMYEEIGVKANYVCSIGVSKWIHILPSKPSFL